VTALRQQFPKKATDAQGEGRNCLNLVTIKYSVGCSP
jgi:hypothetical protein